jgi:hypothetical protein
VNNFLQHMQLLPQIKIDIHKLHAREILKRIITNSHINSIIIKSVLESYQSKSCKYEAILLYWYINS